LRLLGPRGHDLFPLVRHTAVPTLLQSGLKYNVIPGEASVVLDGRILPGFTPDDLLAEVRAVTGDLAELEVIRFQPGPPSTDLSLFPTLATILRELDPAGTPLPLMLSGATDARFFSRLGIQTYGFTPLRLPPDFAFARVIHAADERVPIDALEFGVSAYQKVLQVGQT
jgi:acetylornithine deacetylase/succinyl-diaminopimelate desuccinylase-like protein